MAMENGPFIGDYPMNTSMHRGFSSQPCLMKPEGSWMDESVCQVPTRVTEFGALGHCHRLWMCQGALGCQKWMDRAEKKHVCVCDLQQDNFNISTLW